MNDRLRYLHVVRPIIVFGGVAAMAIAVLPGPSTFAVHRAEQGGGTKEWAYVGSPSCKKCHIKQYKSWSETKMANAFELLKPNVRPKEKEAAGLDPKKDYTTDKTCIRCHTTGYGKPGGFVSFEETPDLVGIGCEMCHGPGEGYLQDGFMTVKNRNYKFEALAERGLFEPNASTCTGACHNVDSPFFDEGEAFDWETRKDQGTHEHKALMFKHN